MKMRELNIRFISCIVQTKCHSVESTFSNISLLPGYVLLKPQVYKRLTLLDRQRGFQFQTDIAEMMQSDIQLSVYENFIIRIVFPHRSG